MRLFPKKPGAQQPLLKSAVPSALRKCDHLGGSRVPTTGSLPADYLAAFHSKLKQLRFLWPVMHAELSSLCYRSPRLDRVFSLIFQLESKSLVSQALSFLLFLPQIHRQIKCAHNVSNLMRALTVLTAEHAHVLLSSCLLGPDCPLAAAAFGFLAFVIEPMGYPLFYCLPFNRKAGLLSQRCHVSPFLLYCRVPWVAT